MGLRDKFKSVVKSAAVPALIGGGIFGAGGAAMGGLYGASKADLGGDGEDGFERVNPQMENFRKAKKDVIDERGNLGKDVRKSTAMLTDRQAKDFMRARDQLGAQGQSSMQTSINNAALTGGFDQGALERMGRQNLRQDRIGNQEINIAEARQKSQTEAGDIANQEAFKDQLLLEVPKLELAEAGVLQDAQRTNAALAMQSQANAAGAKGALGGLIGAGAGLAMGGGPMGAMAGGMMGKGLFSLG
jgi:hypothetical protein